MLETGLFLQERRLSVPTSISPFEWLRTNGQPGWVQADALRAQDERLGSAEGNATMLVDGRSGFRLGGRNDGLRAQDERVGAGAAGHERRLAYEHWR